MLSKIKRQLKRRIDGKTKLNFRSLPAILLVISLAIFCTTQLSVNLKLSPLGKQLQSFNTEKNLLQQENSEIEKDLANSQSLTVIEHITNEKYRLNPTNTDQLVYVTPNVVASR